MEQKGECANTPEEKAQEKEIYKDYYTQEMFEWWITHPYRRHTLNPFRKYIAGLNSPGGGRPRVLEVASGAGVNLTLIAKDRMDVIPIGFDLSPEGVRIASKVGTGYFFQADAEQIPCASGSMDAVLLIGAIHHFWRNPSRLLSEAHRVLRKGGYLFVLDPNGDKRMTLGGRIIVRLTHFILDTIWGSTDQNARLSPVPESETEHPMQPEAILANISTLFRIVNKGFREWLSFDWRHHRRGFRVAVCADVLVSCFGERQMNMFYVVARKKV